MRSVGRPVCVVAGLIFGALSASGCAASSPPAATAPAVTSSPAATEAAADSPPASEPATSTPSPANDALVDESVVEAIVSGPVKHCSDVSIKRLLDPYEYEQLELRGQMRDGINNTQLSRRGFNAYSMTYYNRSDDTSAFCVPDIQIGPGKTWAPPGDKIVVGLSHGVFTVGRSPTGQWTNMSEVLATGPTLDQVLPAAAKKLGVKLYGY